MAKAGWGGFGRSGLSSGKCEIRDKGVSWRSGGWATPQTEISGTFHLAWSVVDAAQAYPLPGKIRGLGGGVTFKLSHDKGTVEGQFLGSVSGMSKALELSRLSSADPLGAGSEWHGQAQEGAKYFVLSGDDGKPIMLARVGWPGVHECITPAVRIGLHAAASSRPKSTTLTTPVLGTRPPRSPRNGGPSCDTRPPDDGGKRGLKSQRAEPTGRALKLVAVDQQRARPRRPARGSCPGTQPASHC